MTVHLERVGNRIHLTSPRPISGLGRKIPGASFSAGGGAPRWSMPLTWATAILLRQQFPDATLGPALTAWGRAEADREQRGSKLRKAKRAKLPRLKATFPVLHRAVRKGRPYQSVGARWIADGQRVLIGDTVGLGKTPQALAGVVESGVAGPYLVVCPKTAVESVWAPEIQQWLPGQNVFTLPEGKAKRDALLNILDRIDLHDVWVVVHPEALRTKSWWVCRECKSETLVNARPKVLDCGHNKNRTTTRHDHVFPQLFRHAWGAVILDESDRAIIRLTGQPTMVRRGLEILRESERDDCLFIAQSGTPFRSRPKLLWSTLNWLEPKTFSGFWSWVETYFQVTENFAGGRVIGPLRADREALLYQALDKIMLRRTREEVLKHLPRKLYIGHELNGTGPVAVWLPMGPEQTRAHEQMRAESVAEVEGGTVSAIGSLAEFTRMKQFATSAGRMEGDEFRPALPSNKYDYLVQMLVELGFPDDPQTKVVVVSQFTSVLKLFQEALDREFGAGVTCLLTGGVSGKQRKAVKDAFNTVGSAPHIMLLNTKAGGAAITLDAADEMVFLDVTGIPDDQEQAEGRIDNRRPEEKIVQRRYRYLMSLGSVEEAIAAVTGERGAETHHVLDGRRGIELAREILAWRP